MSSLFSNKDLQHELDLQQNKARLLRDMLRLQVRDTARKSDSFLRLVQGGFIVGRLASGLLRKKNRD